VSVLCLRELTDEQLVTKGVAVPASEVEDGYLNLSGAVEKPSLEAAPSRLGLLGRYVFTSEVFEILEQLEPGRGGEIQLTDAINELGRRKRLRGYVATSDILDVGTPIGLLEASVVLGEHQFGSEFSSWLEDERES
jgi:UTP--glucose-1-phosphate uridylyltransferase